MRVSRSSMALHDPPRAAPNLSTWDRLSWRRDRCPHADAHRHREINAHQNRLPWYETGKQPSRRVIEFGGRLLDALAVAAVSKPVDDRHANLAQDTRWEVTGALCRNTDCQAVLAALLRDGVEGVEPRVGKLVAHRDIEELMSLVDGNNQWDSREGAGARPRKQCLTEDIDDNLSEVVREGEVT